MNNDIIKNVIKKQCPTVKKYEFLKNAIIYTDANDKKFVAKENAKNNIINIYNYLNSRGFGYLPRLIYYNNDGYVYEYVDDILTPKEQIISDVIKMDALLHNKTVYYKDEATRDSIAVNKYNDQEVQTMKPGSYKKGKWTPDRSKAPYKRK